MAAYSIKFPGPAAHPAKRLLDRSATTLLELFLDSLVLHQLESRLFLNCTKNTELTLTGFARRVALTSHEIISRFFSPREGSGDVIQRCRGQGMHRGRRAP